MSLHHPRSPSPQMLQNHINSPHINDYSHFMYNSVQEDSDLFKQRSKNSFTAYRSPPFNAYNGNPRPAPSSNFVQSYSSDSYAQHIDAQPSSRFDLGEESHTYVGIDQYGNNETGSMLLQSPPAPAPQPQQPPYSQAPYIAGLTHIQSQVVYGPHLSGPLNQASTATTTTMSNSSGAAQSGSQQEEISTIFVVGFPDDMQVSDDLIDLNSVNLILITIGT
jgi:hypothetical protein